MATPYAFVTLVSSDSYLPGALTLAGALKDVHPRPVVPPEVEYQSVCLVTPETVDVSTIKLLRRAFDVVIGVEVITQEDETGLALLGRLDLNTVLTKLHVFRLTQFSKVIFLDADILPIRPLSHLFTLPYEFSASPDVGWPDIFNSGVMVLSPGEDKFNELTELLKSKGSWDGGDQGILNEWRGGNWNRLSFTYNTTPTAAYTYAPAYERFGSQISAIHFIGPNKPWSALSYRTPFSSQSTAASDSRQQAYDYNSLVDRWYAVYDKHHRSQALSQQPRFEMKRYESAWNERRVPAASAPAEDILNLEDLKRLALEGMNAAARTPYDDKPSDDKAPEGQYQSLPLEGRVDLMRLKVLSLTVEEPAPEEGPRVKEVAKEKNRPEVLDVSNEEDLRTPTARHGSLPGVSSPQWRMLSTPEPSEVPPSPHPHPIPLPPVTPPAGYDLQPFQPPSEPESPSKPTLPHDEKQSAPSPPQDQPPQAEHQAEHRKDPPRSRSPTMLLWNPAVEPPPTETPLSSAFPSSTYFPNAWDSSPSKATQQPHTPNIPHTPVPDSGALFEPLPRPEIPESLVRQGHYRNVTGEDQHGATPSPDHTKIKHVFPWEEKPRHLPGRVFPVADSPKPSLFLSPESQTSQTSSSEVPTTPETKSSLPPPVLSPLYGLPSSFTYPNAWDTIPSIKRYASKLARPPAPQPLAPAFDDHWDRRRTTSWDEKAEASSRDGDVEDEGDESSEEPVAGAAAWDDDNMPQSAKALQRSRRGSAARTIAEIRARYRDFGVQTIPREMRAQGVQTTTPVTSPEPQSAISPEAENKPTLSNKRHWTPSGRPNVSPTVTVHDSENGRDVSAASAVPFPSSGPQRRLSKSSPQSPSLTTHIRSPLASSPSPQASRPMKINTPPLKSPIRSPHSPANPIAPAVTRQPSNDSSLGSPASSIGPVSPSDGQPIPSPQRKGGRVWDPARGVELFKRGSEEVLARFLKMGSWEDENH
ncbi:glycosyltransferase family 8 protein [Lyophyllum atratum]|nr:glycosyltransferase family 8 protein [Lyophyllum atratum]